MNTKTSPFYQDLLQAEIKANEVQFVANKLADLMKAIHGGDSRIDIAHDRGMIMIRQH